jgi:hypothetical protein
MPITQSLNSKANVKKPTSADLPFSPAQPVLNTYTAVSTANQTSISSLGFSVDTINAADAFFLFVNGVMLTRGQDYNFAAVAADGTASAITLLSALPANLNIKAVKLGIKPEPLFGVDNRIVGIDENLQQGFQAFIRTADVITATTTTGTPAAGKFYSTITNRAPISDISQDLKVGAGINRIMVSQLATLDSEIGPSNQQVWISPSDTLGLIRFVGPGWAAGAPAMNDANGPKAYSATANDYVEVTFYGTALNMLTYSDSSGPDIRASIDGGSETGSSIVPTTSNVLATKNYSQNVVRNVASGLAMGIHTAKIRMNSDLLIVYGFEIIASASSIVINPGTMYASGQKIVTASQSSLAFASGVTGTRGGRSVVYQNADGSIGTAFTATGSQLNLSSATHANEEITKVAYIREFSAGRADDFSVLTNSSNYTVAYTLDDNTTTLAGLNVRSDVGPTGEFVLPNTSSSYVLITFVGTGLDIIRASDTGSGAMDANTVYVDGTSIGTLASLGLYNVANYRVNQPIVSGLPYGTHTVSFLRTATVSSIYCIAGFRIYGPKKPSIPTGATPLADYCTLGQFSQAIGASNTPISQGVIRKNCVREITYVGGGWISGLGDPRFVGGALVEGNTNGGYLEYTFFGTGFDMRFTQDTDKSSSNTVSIDGAAYTGTGTTYGGGTWTAGTSILNQNGSQVFGCGFIVQGLSLGLHTLRITSNTTGYLDIESLDIITPVHSYKTLQALALQGESLVGSQGAIDDRNTTPVKELSVLAKGLAQAIGRSSSPTTTSTTAVLMPDMMCPIKTSGGPLLLMFSASLYNSSVSGALGTVQFAIDGQVVGPGISEWNPTAGAVGESISMQFLQPVAAGSHLVQVFWQTNSGTMVALQTSRTLTVKEL